MPPTARATNVSALAAIRFDGLPVVDIDAGTGNVRAPRGSFSHVTPRAGLIYSASDDIDLFASVSGLYEPPTNFELEDEATGTDAILDAMSGTVLEIGTRGRRDGTAGRQFFWEASLTAIGAASSWARRST